MMGWESPVQFGLDVPGRSGMIARESLISKRGKQ